MKQREIKFRNWYKVREGRVYADITPPKMIYLSNQKTIDDGTTLLFTEKERDWIDESDFEDPILMQYTGLADKNGKDIYEGDILGLEDIEDESKCTVVFKDGCFCMMFSVDGKVFYSKFEPWDLKTWIIIGNIYENHYLLV